MKFDGVILYGPPASGKDAVTVELCKLSSAYAYFKKLKVGDGRSAGYRPVTELELGDLRGRGLIVHEIGRYGASYAVDTYGLDKILEGGRIPIVHMGQVEGVDAVRRHGGRWLDVLLWCSRGIAAERLEQRGSVDVGDRLRAWDETLVDLGSSTEPQFTLSVRTDAVAPATTAALIHTTMM